MNEALLQAVESARKEELREVLKEILPSIVKEAINESKEEQFLMQKEVAELWDVTPKTARKRLKEMIAKGKVNPQNIAGAVRYRFSEVR